MRPLVLETRFFDEDYHKRLLVFETTFFDERLQHKGPLVFETTFFDGRLIQEIACLRDYSLWWKTVTQETTCPWDYILWWKTYKREHLSLRLHSLKQVLHRSVSILQWRLSLYWQPLFLNFSQDVFLMGIYGTDRAVQKLWNSFSTVQKLQKNSVLLSTPTDI